MSSEVTVTDVQAELIRQADITRASLNVWETPWRDRQRFLARRGYMLRPRYRPDWTPSWRGTGKHPMYFEDGTILPARQHLIDATRVSDGTLVYIKRVETGDSESRIASFLSTPTLLKDPRNHCVPVLDLFEDEEDSNTSYMVMPFLRLVDDPPSGLVIETMDFVDQVLEGLVFIHEQGVAHRDCTYKNLMMDAAALYPHRFHPVNDTYLPDSQTPAHPLSRTSTSIKYYYVDFGISSHILPGQPNLVFGRDGRDQEVPELSDQIPYNPFKVDVFIIGNVFRRYFCENYSNIEFLLPLIDDMTQHDPDARPDAHQALRRWQDIRASLAFYQTHWRLKRKDSAWPVQAVLDSVFLAAAPIRLGKWFFKWLVDVQG